MSLIAILGNNVFSQELVLDDGMYFKNPKPGDGMWVEKVNTADISKDKYSKDNISYKKNRVCIYDYYFIAGKGKAKKKFLLSENTSQPNPLNLTNYERLTDETIDKIMINVTDNKETYPECVNDSTCTQTTFDYSYLKRASSSGDTGSNYFQSKNSATKYVVAGTKSTGLYDNAKNLWMHPPRQYTFKILQLSPFPFYRLDESVKHWAWNVEIGGNYLDPRWIEAKEKIQVRYDYERGKDEIIKSAFGNINCKVTYGTGSSPNFSAYKSSLKSYYNPQYGFVRLEYENIDGSKLVIQLVEMN